MTASYCNLHLYLHGATLNPATLQSPLTGFYESEDLWALPCLFCFLLSPQAHSIMYLSGARPPWRQHLYLQCWFLQPKVRVFMESMFGRCYGVGWCVQRKKGEMGLRAAWLGMILLFLDLRWWFVKDSLNCAGCDDGNLRQLQRQAIVEGAVAFNKVRWDVAWYNIKKLNWSPILQVIRRYHQLWALHTELQTHKGLFLWMQSWFWGNK